MRLTALEIRKQEFKKVLRGFDPLEVETFLEMVADEYETLAKAKNELAEKVRSLETRVRDYEQMENTLQKTLMDAQQTVDQSKESSKREADLVIREAEIQAERVLDEARRELSRLKNEIAMVQSQKNGFVSRLKQLLRSQIELIEVLELDDSEVERPKPTAGKIREVGGLETSGTRRPIAAQQRPVTAPVKHPVPDSQGMRESIPKIIKAEERRDQARPQVPKEQVSDSKVPARDVPPKSNPSDLIDRMILEQEQEDTETVRPVKRDSSSMRPKSDE